MKRSKLLVLRYFFWFLTFLIMLLLFGLSSQTRAESASISGGITEQILRFLYRNFENMSEESRINLISTFHALIRKLAHFTAFAFMGAFSSVAMLTYTYKRRIKVTVPLIIGLLYATTDELHQAFVPGRGPMVLDVFLDFFGCLCGTACVFLLVYYFCERSKESERR